jgi:RNA polymerase sigma factor (sigma-70 family)
VQTLDRIDAPQSDLEIRPAAASGSGRGCGMRDDPTVVALVHRARAGDQGARDEIVERYAPLVWAICRRYRLSPADIDDVGQSVWLRLVEHLPELREPAALPGWLATTTERECLRVARLGQRQERFERVPGTELAAPPGRSPTIEDEVLAAERNATLREAFAQLPPRCRELLSLLMGDPPVPYGEISALLGIPVGGIGPTRARCLDKLRRRPVMLALINAEIEAMGGGERHDQPVVER